MEWFSGFAFGIMTSLAMDVLFQRSSNKNIVDYMQSINELLESIIKKLEG